MLITQWIGAKISRLVRKVRRVLGEEWKKGKQLNAQMFAFHYAKRTIRATFTPANFDKYHYELQMNSSIQRYFLRLVQPTRVINDGDVTRKETLSFDTSDPDVNLLRLPWEVVIFTNSARGSIQYPRILPVRNRLRALHENGLRS